MSAEEPPDPLESADKGLPVPPPVPKRRLLPSLAKVHAAIDDLRGRIARGEAYAVDPGEVPIKKSGRVYGRDYVIVHRTDGNYRVVGDGDGEVVDCYKIEAVTGRPFSRMCDEDKSAILMHLHDGYGVTQAARLAGQSHHALLRARKDDPEFDARVRDAARTRVEVCRKLLYDAVVHDEDLAAAYRLMVDNLKTKAATAARKQWRAEQALRERLVEARIKQLGFEIEPQVGDMRALEASEFKQYKNIFERVNNDEKLLPDEELFFARTTIRLMRADRVRAVEG